MEPIFKIEFDKKTNLYVSYIRGVRMHVNENPAILLEWAKEYSYLIEEQNANPKLKIKLCYN